MKTHKKNRSAGLAKKKTRRWRRLLRFDEVKGKTVEFIEMSADLEFPCVEIGFDDKTAFLVLVDARVTMEAAYSDWKTGNLRVLRQWPVVDCR